MRLRILALVVCLASLALVGSSAASADAAASPRMRGDIHISMSQLQAYTDQLRSDRVYLANNKNKAAWAARAPRVISTMDQVGAGFSGSSASAIAQLRARFVEAARAQPHPKYVDGLQTIDALTSRLQAIIDAYGGGGGGCQFCS